MESGVLAAARFSSYTKKVEAQRVTATLGTNYNTDGSYIVDPTSSGTHYFARGHLSRPAHDQRSAETLFIHPTLVEPPMLSQVESLVGTANYDGILGET